MSEMAASEGAAIHLNIHWDSSGGSKKGLHTYSPTKPYSDVGSLSKDVAKAMYDAGKSFFSDENTVSPGYTTLNWATVPTLIVECGYMTAKDYGQYYDSNAATRKKHMNSWAKDRKKVFVAAVEAAIDSDN
jgi:N-acetylmuramoyl-L-alanine amidase